jgi:ABC-type Fe3+ transport system substrate-binding protein
LRVLGYSALSLSLLVLACLAGVLLLNSCGGDKPSLVLYSDVDHSIVEPLIKDYTAKTKVQVEVTYADPKDVARGVGLSDRLRTESGSPKADIYWACGPAAMEKLRQDEIVEGGGTTNASQIPKQFVGQNGKWFGVGARVRVILFNKHNLTRKTAPKSVASLEQPQWKGRCALADPINDGSSHYHITFLFASFSSTQDAKKLLRGIKTNAVQILPDDAAIIDAVASGKADWGVVDSDHAWSAVQAGKPVDYLPCDQEPFVTADALGKPRGSGVPSVGTPILSFPLSLVNNRPHIHEGYDFTSFLTSAIAASRLAALAPGLMPTHQDMIDACKQTKNACAIDPSRLIPLAATEANIDNARPEAENAINSIFGSQ